MKIKYKYLPWHTNCLYYFRFILEAINKKEVTYRKNIKSDRKCLRLIQPISCYLVYVSPLLMALPDSLGPANISFLEFNHCQVSFKGQ